MRFHYGESMTRPEYYVPLARAAEQAGFDGFAMPDSLCYPQSSDTKYSYTDDGGRQFLENKPFPETFMLASALSAVTERLQLTTNVIKLPVRPPVYSAKLAATIASLSNNRFNFGVGLSVWPEDYEVMGVPWARRGKRIDECIAIVRGLTAGGYYEFHGDFYDFSPIKLNPVPSQPIPILIGGHSDAALKRAARNDGWMYAGGGVDAMLPLLAKLRAFREESDAVESFRIFAAALGDGDLDAIRRYGDAGTTDVIVVFRNLYALEEDRQPLERKIDDLNRFADDVLARI